MSKKASLTNEQPNEQPNRQPNEQPNALTLTRSNAKSHNNFKDRGYKPTREQCSEAGKKGNKALRLKQLREATQKKIDAYFDSCLDGNKQYHKPPTDSGITMALDLPTTADFKRAARSGSGDPCQDIYARARLRVEEYYESQLAMNRNATGSIFKLKNLNNDGWQDVQEVKTQTKQEIDLSISAALKDVVKEIVNDKY